jgi:CelD/BcsL family acetyltransferase involved in cellulose biosynthesis
VTPSVKVLTGLQAMKDIVPAWDDLAARALEPNPFYESWMLLPAIEAFGLERSFRLVTIWTGGQLDAVVPLERTKGFKGLPLPAFTSWRHRHMLLSTPLVRQQGATETLDALVEWLKKAPEGAEIAGMQHLVKDAAFHRMLVEVLKDAGIRPLAVDSYQRPVLRRRRDADTYMAENISAKDRTELRRRERRLVEQGALSYVALEGGEDVGRWIEEFLQLEASGWKGKEGTALACTEANRRFATEIFAAAYQRGRLHIVGVDLDGKPIARCTSFIAGPGSYAFKPAYHEAYAKFSPGIIAEVARIRHFHGMPEVRWMDSFTDAGNTVMSRLWSDRITVESIAFGTRITGALTVAAWPFLRWAKSQGRRALSAASRGRGQPAPARPQPASAP